MVELESFWREKYMNEISVDQMLELDVLDDSLYDLDSSDLSLVLYEKSQNILMEKTKNLIEKSPVFIEYLEKMKPIEYFDVNMSNNAKELYEKGELILKYSKNKKGLLPTLSSLDGKFSEQVTLEPRLVTPELSSALTNLSMQYQLTQLMDQMKLMNQTIQRIEIGQRDDRLALYFSSRQQYIEAIAISNKELQSYALLNAVNVANNAKFLLMQSIRSDIEQIVHNSKLKKKERDKLSQNVRTSLKYVNEATGLCVMTYSGLGEDKPLLASLKSYQRFISQTLLKKEPDGLSIADKLHQNWPGADDKWLSMPKEIVDNLESQILIKAEVTGLIESEDVNEEEV